VTISSWLNFGLPAPPREGVCGGAKFFGSALLQPARSVCVSSERFFIFVFFSTILWWMKMNTYGWVEIDGEAIFAESLRIPQAIAVLRFEQSRAVRLGHKHVTGRKNEWMNDVGDGSLFFIDCNRNSVSATCHLDRMLVSWKGDYLDSDVTGNRWTGWSCFYQTLQNCLFSFLVENLKYHRDWRKEIFSVWRCKLSK